jgi:hypothetical protein
MFVGGRARRRRGCSCGKDVSMYGSEESRLFSDV